jgi:hypothetical protein
MVVQRGTKNLGLNRSKNREYIFEHIENVLSIKEKKCSMGSKKNAYGIKHTGQNPLPIRNFNLLDCYIDPQRKVIIGKGDGLQGNCMVCERKYRAGRINKNRNKFSSMTSKEIYADYKINYRDLKVCSACKKDKIPEDFPISLSMETGLHNTCKLCSKAYTESVGNRWVIYSPDGHEVIKINNIDSCQKCGSKKNLHKDHIWPISKGGTDNKENIQILCGPHNLSKSATIVDIKSVNDIHTRMICYRYRDILKVAKREHWDVVNFELAICEKVRDFILWKKSLTNANLKAFFETEKQRNNRKHSTDHSVKKFRQYCEAAILNTNEYISKNN